jgi:hypothetical protein
MALQHDQHCWTIQFQPLSDQIHQYLGWSVLTLSATLATRSGQATVGRAPALQTVIDSSPIGAILQRVLLTCQKLSAVQRLTPLCTPLPYLLPGIERGDPLEPLSISNLAVKRCRGHNTCGATRREDILVPGICNRLCVLCLGFFENQGAPQ